MDIMNKKIKKALLSVTLGVSLFGGTAGLAQASDFQFILDNAKQEFLDRIDDSVRGSIQDSRAVHNERRAQEVLNKKSAIIAQGIHTRRQEIGRAHV